MPRYNPYKVTKHPRQKQNLFLRNTPPHPKPQNPAPTKHKTQPQKPTEFTNHQPQHKASKAKSIPTINAPSPQRNQPQHPLIRLAAQNRPQTPTPQQRSQPQHPLIRFAAQNSPHTPTPIQRSQPQHPLIRLAAQNRPQTPTLIQRSQPQHPLIRLAAQNSPNTAHTPTLIQRNQPQQPPISFAAQNTAQTPTSQHLSLLPTAKPTTALPRPPRCTKQPQNTHFPTAKPTTAPYRPLRSTKQSQHSSQTPTSPQRSAPQHPIVRFGVA